MIKNDLEDLNNLMQEQEQRRKENNEILLQNSEYKKIFDKIQKLEKQKEEMCKKINLRSEKAENNFVLGYYKDKNNQDRPM